MIRILKAIFFWGYARNTWQYDVLCVLILAFIFLTPKGWFENSELRWRDAHQNSSASSQMLITPDFNRPELSRREMEQCLREVTGRSDLTITDVRARRDAAGKILVYEVDIR